MSKFLSVVGELCRQSSAGCGMVKLTSQRGARKSSSPTEDAAVSSPAAVASSPADHSSKTGTRSSDVEQPRLPAWGQPATAPQSDG